MSTRQSFSGCNEMLFLRRGQMGSTRGDCRLTFSSGHLREAKEVWGQPLVLTLGSNPDAEREHACRN